MGLDAMTKEEAALFAVHAKQWAEKNGYAKKGKGKGKDDRKGRQLNTWSWGGWSNYERGEGKGGKGNPKGDKGKDEGKVLLVSEIKASESRSVPRVWCHCVFGQG